MKIHHLGKIDARDQIHLLPFIVKGFGKVPNYLHILSLSTFFLGS